MYIPRLLFFSLLISGCAAPVVAQSASDNEPGSFYSQPPGPLPPETMASIRLIPIQPLIEINRLHSPYAKAETVQPREYDWSVTVSSQFHKRVPGPDDATCYSIRAYRVTRDDPESDSTRPAGYSTCQPATKFQVKKANDRQEVVPR